MTLDKIRQHIQIAMEILDCIPEDEFEPIDDPVTRAYNTLDDAQAIINSAINVASDMEDKS